MHLQLKHCLWGTAGDRSSAQLCQCFSELQGIHILRCAASVRQSHIHDQGDYQSLEEYFPLDRTDCFGLCLGNFYLFIYFYLAFVV